MPKTTTIIITRALAALVAFSGAAAFAADAPSPPPMPPAGKNGNGERATSPTPQPEVRTYRKGDQLVEEYRLNNRLYMLKIMPDNGEPYYLIDQTGAGRFSSGRVEPENSVPLWVIKKFSLGRERKPEPRDDQ